MMPLSIVLLYDSHHTPLPSPVCVKILLFLINLNHVKIADYDHIQCLQLCTLLCILLLLLLCLFVAVHID